MYRALGNGMIDEGTNNKWHRNLVVYVIFQGIHLNQPVNFEFEELQFQARVRIGEKDAAQQTICGEQGSARPQPILRCPAPLRGLPRPRAAVPGLETSLGYCHHVNRGGSLFLPKLKNLNSILSGVSQSPPRPQEAWLHTQ